MGLGGTFLRQGTGLDYSATAAGGRAILTAAVPEPAGFAFLARDIDVSMRCCGCIRPYRRGRVAVCRMAAMASTVSRCPAATLITSS
jgi:hypothetical protein